MPERISRRKLEELESTLSDRDKSILNLIHDYRYLTTEHIHRLCFTKSATAKAGLRAASRNLKKLKDLKLLGSLDRRVGGIFSGSGSYIWRLDAAGDHLLRMMDVANRPRRKSFEPSVYFLAHTLAVSECYVRLTEICKDIKLTEAQNEPNSWRPYNSGGKMVTFKPDLFAVTLSGSYEDRWFIEIDMATESPAKIIEKCRRYHKYYLSGLEQKQYGVFPLVVWVVPDTNRKLSIIRHIQDEFSKLPNVFTVITPDELEALIQCGAGTLC